MDERLMPLATFRCDTCGLEESVTLDRFTRRAGELDVCHPHPRHHGAPMRLVQVDYQGN